MSEWLGLPVRASAHGATIDHLLVLIHGFIVVMVVGWLAFGLYALWRFRRKRNPHADAHGAKSHASFGVEVGVIAFEIVLFLGIALPFWVRNASALPEPGENPVTVRVVAQQFAWNIHYPGADGVFGATRPDLMDDTTNPLGLDYDDPHAKDDIVTLNQLYLPLGRPAVVHLSSKDVIHSFGLPEFRVKQDAIPGMTATVSFTPTLTTADFQTITGDDARTFEIVCSQLCGLGHFRMRGFVHVLAEDDFETWLADNAPSGEPVDPFWN